MVLWLARHLLPTGHRIALISRGYRQRSTAPVTVVADPQRVRLTPPMAADEAYLLARALPGVTLLTGRNRPELIRYAVERFNATLILMDDGFQRLDVKKDLELVLLDAQRPFGNGRLLPGGLLREFPSALKRCDALILTRANQADATQKTQRYLKQYWPDKPILTAIHHPTAWIPLQPDHPPLPLHALPQPVLAFCGIATPSLFLQTLRAQNIQTTSFHPFPDHHFFTTQEIDQLQHRAKISGAKAIICTEKDAVKLDHTQITTPLLALRIEMQLQENSEWLTNRLQSLLTHPEIIQSVTNPTPDCGPHPPASPEYHPE